MTKTVLDWISRSLRMLGVLRRGQVPSGTLAADALEAANGLILSLRQVGAAGNLKEVIVTANYTAGENERIVNNLGDDLIVTLPETITDCGEVRVPRNGSRVVIAGNEPVTFIYVASIGWQKVSGLELSDPAPLGPELYTGLCAVLAVHLGPDHDQEPSETVVALAQAGLVSIGAQFWREVSVPAGDEYVIGPDMGYSGGLEGLY